MHVCKHTHVDHVDHVGGGFPLMNIDEHVHTGPPSQSLRQAAPAYICIEKASKAKQAPVATHSPLSFNDLTIFIPCADLDPDCGHENMAASRCS